MKITNVIVDKRTLGKTLLLVDVLPVYQYTNGRRTNTIEGYRYVVVLPDVGFEKVSIKILGEKLMEKPEGSVEVNLEGLEMFIYWAGGEYQLGITATAIKPKTS